MEQRSGVQEIPREQFWASLLAKAAHERVPLRALVELTYGCNLRCVHCYNPTHTAKGELPTDKIKSILDQLAEAGCLEVAFTGGEPMTRRDGFEILTYAKEKGFAITLLTNATMMTPQAADRLQALQPKLVEVSIYGATPATYERVTRIPGSFPLFVRGVGLLRERRVPLLIKMPVMTLNHHETRQAKALVEGWGISFVYSTEIFPRVDGSQEPLAYRLAPSEVFQLDQVMLGSRRWSAEGGAEKQATCHGRDGLFTCMCGRSSLAVTPYGQMNLCVSLPIPKYDLGVGTVAEGWQTLVAVVDRANAHPGETYECPTCPVSTTCRQGPMNAWLETGDLAACLPYFKELAQIDHDARAAHGGSSLLQIQRRDRPSTNSA